MCQVPGCKLSLATEEAIPDDEKHFMCKFENCEARWSNQYMLDQHLQHHAPKKSAYDALMERITNQSK